MEWPQNPPQSPGLLLLDSLQNKFNFSADLKFTLNYFLPRVWITANMSLGFIPVELIISAPATISRLAVALIPRNLPPEPKTHDFQRLLDRNILMVHKHIKLGMSLWSHDALPTHQAPAFHLSEWASLVIKSFKLQSLELCPNPLFSSFCILSQLKPFSSNTYTLSDQVPFPLIQAQLIFYLDDRAKITQMSRGQQTSQLQTVAQSLSCVWLFATPRTAAHQASLSFTVFKKWMPVRLKH